MDINQVRFGNYSIGNQQAGMTKGDAKADKSANEAPKDVKTTNANPENVLSALNLAGMQNLAQIKVASNKEINPTDYLSQDRIADIEAMMGNFEVGVNEIVDVLEDEFPGMLSNDRKLALAASIYEQG